MLRDDPMPEQSTRQGLFVLRVIHLALVTGIVLFASVVWYLITRQAAALPPAGAAGAAGAAPTTGGAPPVDLAVLRLIVGVLTVSAIAVAVLMRHAMMRRLASQDEEPAQKVMFGMHFTAALLGVAIAEGAALFACVILLMSGNQNDLALVAAPLLLMLILTPTRGRWENFRQRIMNERALSSR